MRKQLTIGDRQYIEICLKKKIPVSQIAKDLNRNRSTIYKEIKKGLYVHYDSTAVKDRIVYAYDVAQRVIQENQKRKGRKKKLNPDNPYLKLIAGIVTEQKYSLEAARYKLKENPVCLSTLYHYVHQGYIAGLTLNNLPYAVRKKKTKKKNCKILFRGTSIEQRPDFINDREIYGHWEMDTVYSSRDDKACALTLVERKSRQQLFFWLPDRTAGSVIRCLDRLERKLGSPRFRDIFKSITCDNGVEFADWQSIERSCRTKAPRTKVYKCHPYCSSERGSNENGNKLLRRHVPKGDDFGFYSPEEIKHFQKWANDYPRRMFSGKSANEYIGFELDF